MTSLYHKRALPRNDTGLPEFLGLPLFDWRESPRPRSSTYPEGLTAGGRIIYHRTRRPVSTCNTLARLAGFDCGEVDHA